METVKIRELRGADLRERARNGKPLAITNRGALIGIIIPVTQAWVEHLIDHNWSHARQSIAEGEKRLRPTRPCSPSMTLLFRQMLVAMTRARDIARQRGWPCHLSRLLSAGP